MNKNWVVTYYDKNNRVITSYTIEDRTEHEAENEAMALMPPNADDWTLMPVKNSIGNTTFKH